MPGVRGQRSGGRNRKPRLLHLAEGTYRKGDHAGQDVEAPAGCPELPVGLSAEALAEWHRLTGLLSLQGTLATVDGPMLESHCQLAALVNRIEAEVALLPSLTVLINDVPKAHPLV